MFSTTGAQLRTGSRTALHGALAPRPASPPRPDCLHPRGPPAHSAALGQDSTEPPRKHSSSPEPPVGPAWWPQVPSVRQFQDDAGWLTASWRPQVYPGPGECRTVLTELPSPPDEGAVQMPPCVARELDSMLRPSLPTQLGGEGLALSRPSEQNCRTAGAPVLCP